MKRRTNARNSSFPKQATVKNVHVFEQKREQTKLLHAHTQNQTNKKLAGINIQHKYTSTHKKKQLLTMGIFKISALDKYLNGRGR